ncbi:MAG: lytic transglycosylase domain-containing protein [Acetobacteraceae bacterium]|nr:lytic transglycosylase domain-containing protein [Acetobacteraceae bacterium]
MSASALFAACMAMTAQMFDLPPRLLPAIQATEGGWVGAVRRNPNGSEDLGLMQVNTVWLPRLARASGLPPEELRERLIYDGCFSIQVAGAILRMNLNAERGNLMRAIGNYHSRTPGRNEAYQERVVNSAIRLFGYGTAGRGGENQRSGGQ